MTATGDPDTDVDPGELFGPQNQDGLVQLRSEDLGRKQLERLAVDLDQALALHTARDGCDPVSDWSTASGSAQTEISVPVAFFFLPNTWTAWVVAILSRWQNTFLVVGSGWILSWLNFVCGGEIKWG